MTHKLLENVVLERDLPGHGLRRGDVGVVVETYPGDGLEVEFLTASGDTLAVVTLTGSDVHSAREDEMLSVRSLVSGR